MYVSNKSKYALFIALYSYQIKFLEKALFLG